MEIVEVGKLLKGVGVIIDDAATNEGNMEYHMVKSIIAAGVPMAVFTYIPETSVIDSLGNISFIILDWEFSREIPEEFDGLEMGDEFKKDQKDTILSFLKVLLWELIKQYTVSFIFLIYDSHDFWLNHKTCGIWDSGHSSSGSCLTASGRSIHHPDSRTPVCEES